MGEWMTPNGDRRRGRGARSNAPGRFEPHARSVEADGWDRPDDAPPLRTTVARERPRRVITRNASPDVPFDRSINPYRGCEHGCVYCFARPTHAYLGLSPGLDFETRLTAREGVPERLAEELRAPGYVPRMIAIGTNTDPYQPIEREHRIMRGILRVLAEFGHPVGIVTKGTLIERDIDLLGPLAARGLAQVGISVTTLDAGLARSMEPRVPAPARRLATIRALAGAGIPVQVAASPMIPGLTDHELEPILKAAAQAGATSASALGLRLPREVSPLFREWLEETVPDRAARVMGRVRELHGGRDYDPDWGTRFTGRGVWADLMRQRLRAARRRYGLDAPRDGLRTDLFAPPVRVGDQLTLF
ncbi:MAG: PA0069 family radical SAM protein [Paracoccaceae bacterium]